MTPKGYGPRRLAAVLIALLGILGVAVGTSAVTATPAVAAPAGTMKALATPKWAKQPASTHILTSKVKSLSAYVYQPGKVPGKNPKVLIRLQNPTPQGFKLVTVGYGEENGYWLALLDVRPNNTFAWVKAKDVAVSSTPYSIEVSTGQHRLLLWKYQNGKNQVVGNYPVAVGKPSTPTPTGYFFINTIIHGAGPDYGNIIMSTSGFSNVYTTFGDGDAALGIHGTDEPNLIGQSVSHGCIRMNTANAMAISRLVKVGVPVVVHK